MTIVRILLAIAPHWKVQKMGMGDQELRVEPRLMDVLVPLAEHAPIARLEEELIEQR